MTLMVTMDGMTSTLGIFGYRDSQMQTLGTVSLDTEMDMMDMDTHYG